MSSRYSRPHTPPGPPPSQGSRKSSGRKLSTSSSVTSKAPPSRSYDHHFDKPYSKSSSSSYPPPKAYSNDKYKSASLRKVGSDKVPNSSGGSGGGKYSSKGDAYSSESSSREYKVTREVNYPSGDRYGSKEPHHPHQSLYMGSSYPGEKTRYPDKYLSGSPPPPAPYGDSKYSSKKYADDYDPYPPEKSTGRYASASSSTRHEGSAYYSSGSLGPYSPYNSYSSYGAYGSTYGSRGGTGGYGASDKLAPLSYESDKLASSSYSSLDKLSQVPLHSRDKLSSGGYSDTKLGSRSRLYPEDDRRPYRDYTPPPTCSTRSPVRGLSSNSYSNFGHYSPPSRSPQRQLLNRYVIGDSVVYGPPGHYPRDLRSSSPRGRPPSPPSPQPLMPRSYSRYPASPRRYPSTSSRRSPPASSSQYRSPSPSARRVASPHRPPSPPPRRPPSPCSPQLRTSYRGSQEHSYERARSKDRYVRKASAVRSPARDSRGATIGRSELNSRGDRDKRKEPERRLTGSREKTHDGDPAKRARAGERNAEYHHSTSRGWSSKDTSTAATSNHLSSSHKDRRPRSPPPAARSSLRGGDLPRDRRREESRERDKSRRIEDRLGPSPSQTTRRSPALRSRAPRRAASPRDKRSSSRRHPDLRLWIESRKSEGGKRLGSPSRSRPVTKRVARSSERSTVSKRTRLGDPKKRLGGYKARRRALPIKRNKILKKYQRLTAKRGARVGGSSGKLNSQSSRENGGTRGDRGDEGSKGREDGGGGGGEGSRLPGSTATIRRVIKKPKVLSLVNRMVLKPRVIRKPTQKLLKDPKEETKSKDKTQSESNQKESSSKADDKQTTSSSTAGTTTHATTNASSTTAATTTSTSSAAAETTKRSSSRSTTAPSSSTTTTVTTSSS